MKDYKYLNVNPRQETEPDCVCRAISLALQIPYSIVNRMLNENGDIYTCDDLRVTCYSKLLHREFGLDSKDGRGRTAGYLARLYKNNVLLLRLDGHLTCSIYGVVYDIWDCTDEVCDVYWIVE